MWRVFQITCRLFYLVPPHHHQGVSHNFGAQRSVLVSKPYRLALSCPPLPPQGVPHSLEHSVLCGSRKYPIKEPFVELIKVYIESSLELCPYGDSGTSLSVCVCVGRRLASRGVYLGGRNRGLI